MSKTVAQFVLVSIEGLMPELHASGCRDLKGFNENPQVAESATAALDGLVEAGTLTKDAKIRVMPCTNPVRMRAINRLYEVDDNGVRIEPAAEVAPEPTPTEAPAPAVEETPTLSKSAAKKARKAAKKAAKNAPETTEAPAEVAEVA